MWRDLFLALVDELFREYGLVAPSRVQDGSLPLTVELHIDEVRVEMTHPARWGANRVALEVACGDLGNEPAAGLRRLLQIQHVLDPLRGRSFGLEPDSGQVTLIQCVGLAGMTGPELVRLLDDLAETTRVLRESDWLSTPDASAPPPDFALLA